VEAETGDRLDCCKDSHEAVKQESQRLESNGGPKSESNYNKIESPGKKMREEDAVQK